MADINDLLGNLDDAYQNASDSGGLELDPGHYIMRVKEAEIVKAKNSDRVQVKMHLVVVDESKWKNMDHYSYDLRFTDKDGIPDLRAMGFFKLACTKMGMTPPATIKEAPEAVGRMVDRVIKVELKKNGDFLNTRINALVHPNFMKWVEAGCPVDNPTQSPGDGW